MILLERKGEINILLKLLFYYDITILFIVSIILRYYFFKSKL